MQLTDVFGYEKGMQTSGDLQSLSLQWSQKLNTVFSELTKFIQLLSWILC